MEMLFEVLEVVWALRFVLLLVGIVGLAWLLWRFKWPRIVFPAIVVLAAALHWKHTYVDLQPNIRILTVDGRKCTTQDGLRDPKTPDDLREAEAEHLPYCWY